MRCDVERLLVLLSISELLDVDITDIYFTKGDDKVLIKIFQEPTLSGLFRRWIKRDLKLNREKFREFFVKAYDSLFNFVDKQYIKQVTINKQAKEIEVKIESDKKEILKKIEELERETLGIIDYIYDKLKYLFSTLNSLLKNFRRVFGKRVVLYNYYFDYLNEDEGAFQVGLNGVLYIGDLTVDVDTDKYRIIFRFDREKYRDFVGYRVRYERTVTKDKVSENGSIGVNLRLNRYISNWKKYLVGIDIIYKKDIELVKKVLKKDMSSDFV